MDKQVGAGNGPPAEGERPGEDVTEAKEPAEKGIFKCFRTTLRCVADAVDDKDLHQHPMAHRRKMLLQLELLTDH